jgi:hypothetical protein
MSQKDFSSLRAQVKGSEVEISFYLSTPVFNSWDGSPVNIRIFRRGETQFTFNHDYAEYFDGVTFENAKMIFEGAAELINKRKIVYQDKSIKAGSTYVYWVSLAEGNIPAGPVSVRVRDPQIWWPQYEISRRMQTLADAYPQKVTLRNYGQTIRGNSIQGLTAGNPNCVIALIGAIHPGESGPELIVPAVERILQEHPELLEKTGVAILPSVCIDQREKMVQGNPWYLRKNFNEVDLNRNFPANWENTEYTYGLITADPDAATYRGPAPCSEPETRAIITFIEETKPLCVFSFHCLASICGPCFLTTKYGADDADFRKRCEQFALPYAQGFYGGVPKELALKFACTAGSLNSWLYQEYKIPGFDLEWDGEEKSKISHTDNTTRALLAEYQDRHYQALLRVLQEMS